MESHYDAFPPIEQFLDELPPIEDYLDEETGHYTAEPSSPQISGGPAQDSEGWAITGWQSFDWARTASLGRHAADRAEADSSWNATEWSGPAQDPAAPVSPEGSDSKGGPTADEVASALDGIAQRIRSGELSIDQVRGMPPEVAMAAALAAMMRLRG